MLKASFILEKYLFDDLRSLLSSVSIPNAKQPPHLHRKANGFKYGTDVQHVSNQLTLPPDTMLMFDQKRSGALAAIPAVKGFPSDFSIYAHISAQTIQQSFQRIYPPSPIVFLGIVQRCPQELFTKPIVNVQHERLNEATNKAQAHDNIKRNGKFHVAEACGGCDTTGCAEREEDVWVLRQGSYFGVSRPAYAVFPIFPRHRQYAPDFSLKPQTLLSSASNGANEPEAHERLPIPMSHECSPDRKRWLRLSSSLHIDKSKEKAESRLVESEHNDICSLSDLLQCIFSPVVRNSLSPYLKNILAHTGLNPNSLSNRNGKRSTGPPDSTPCAHQSFHLPFSDSSIVPASYVDLCQGRFAVDAQRLCELAMTTMRQRVPCLVLVDERESDFVPNGGLGVEADVSGLCGNDRRLEKPWARIRFQVEPRLWNQVDVKKVGRDILPTVSLPTTSFDVAVYTERMPLQSLTPHADSHSKFLSELFKSQRQMDESRGVHNIDAKSNLQLDTAVTNTERKATSPKGSTQRTWVWNGNFWVEEVDPQLSRVAHAILDQVQRNQPSCYTSNNKKHLTSPGIPKQLTAWVPPFWWDFRSHNSKPCFPFTHRVEGACTGLDPLLQFTIELRKTWTVTGLDGIRELFFMGSMRLKRVVDKQGSCRSRLVDGDGRVGGELVDLKKSLKDMQPLSKHTERMKAAEKTLTVASLLSSPDSPPPNSLALPLFNDCRKGSVLLDDSHDEPMGALEVEMGTDALFMKSVALDPHSRSPYLLNSSEESFSRARYPAYNALTGMPLRYSFPKCLHAPNKKSGIRGDVSPVAESCWNKATGPLHLSEATETRLLRSLEGYANPFEYSFASQQICWVPKNAAQDAGLLVPGNGLGSEKGAFEQPRVRALVDPDEFLTGVKATARHEVHHTGFPFHQLPPWITNLNYSTDVSANYRKVNAGALTGIETLPESASQETLLQALLEHAPSPVTGCVQSHRDSDGKAHTGDCGGATVWVLQLDPTHCYSHMRDPDLAVFLPVQGLLWQVYRAKDTKVNFIFSMSDVLQSSDAKGGSRQPGGCDSKCSGLKVEPHLIRRLLHSIFETRCRMQCRSYDSLCLSAELETASYFFLDVRAALHLLEVIKPRKGSLNCPARVHSIHEGKMSTVEEEAHNTGARQGRDCTLSAIEASLNRTADQDWLEEYQTIWLKYSSWDSRKDLGRKGECCTTTPLGDPSTRWFLSPSSFVDYFVTRCKQRLFWKLEELDTALSLADFGDTARVGEKATLNVCKGGPHPDCAEMRSTAASPSREEEVGEACTDDRGESLSLYPLSPQEEAFLAQFEILRDDDTEGGEGICQNAMHAPAGDLGTLGDFPAVDRRCYGPGARLSDALIHPNLPPTGGVRRLSPSVLGLECKNAILHANKIGQCVRQHSPYSCLGQTHYNHEDNILQTHAREACTQQRSYIVGVNMKLLPNLVDMEKSRHRNTPALQEIPINSSAVEMPSFFDIHFPRLACANQVEACIAEEQRRLQKRWSPWLRLLRNGMTGKGNNDSVKSYDVYNEIPLSVPLSPLARMLCTLEEMQSAHTRSFEARVKALQDDEIISLGQMSLNEQNDIPDGLCCWDLGLTIISISYDEHYINASNLSFSNLEADKKC